MNAPQAIHPTDQTLQSYGLGKLDDLLVEVVSKHVDSCSDCQRRVSELAPDSFLGKLRDAQGRTDSSAPVVSSTGSPSRPADGPRSSAPPLSETLPPGLVDHPDYEILRELGRGGVGVVYLAKNKLMGRHEVLKVVSSHLVNRPGVMERFLGEIRNAARLHHPNIVTAYSALRFDESLVLAMEYVEGLDLARMVKTKGPLSVVHACYFINQAALGLQHAHDNGMVHRDIKPDNLMLVRSGNRAMVKILDFGLAKVRRERNADGTLTAAGQLLGTPDFIAPEQINDARQADIRADIYSLGCTFYYLLTGRPPFQATTLYEMYQAHHSMDAPLLNLMRPDVPMELAVLVATMMAKEPERRFQTPREVTQALGPFLRKENPAAQQSKPELSLANAAVPFHPSAGPALVPTQPAMTASPALTPPAQAGSAWDTLIETRPQENLSDEVRALRQRQSVPSWMWPVAAVGLLLVGLGVGWGLRTDSGANKTSPVPPASLASSVGKIEPPGPVKKPVEVHHGQDEVPPVPSASKRESSDTKLASRDRKNASSFGSESLGRGDESRQEGTSGTAKEEPADTKPAPTQTAAAPKEKPDAELSPEELLERRGLKKKGKFFYVIPAEDDVEAGYNRLVPFWKTTEAAWGELSEAVQIELYVQALDDKRINLQAYINDLNGQLAGLPNNVTTQLARRSLQQEIQGTQAEIGNTNREYAIAVKRRPGPGRIERLREIFLKRRSEFFDESDKLKPTFDKVKQIYAELKENKEVVNAILALKEQMNAPIKLGPSEFCMKAFSQIKESQKMLSYDPDAYKGRKKPKLKQSPKGKK